jgi:AcrR family transcriptional regulator
MAQNTKERLIQATMRLVAEGGAHAATVRAIARAVGVTEGAVYRHFPSKEQLYAHAYERVVDDMYAEKLRLLHEPGTFAEKCHEWVRLTYAYYDAQPEAFTYVLLTRAIAALMDSTVTTKQGRILTELLEQAQRAGEVRALPIKLTLSHFTGLMLNVPRLINEGALPAPASQYADEVADAIGRALRP